jgi:hypothetical protein
MKKQDDDGSITKGMIVFGLISAGRFYRNDAESRVIVSR